MISSLVFLIVGGAFVLTLFKGIFKLIGQDSGPAGLNGKALMKIFMIPILCFLTLMIYVLWILPYLNANGMQ